MLKLNAREEAILETAMFSFLSYVQACPDNEYTREANGLLKEDEESDFDYTEQEIADVYNKIGSRT